jgi:hypothetical protein
MTTVAQQSQIDFFKDKIKVINVGFKGQKPVQSEELITKFLTKEQPLESEELIEVFFVEE